MLVTNTCISDCPAGTYYHGDMYGNAECSPCARGAFSLGRSSFCTSCPSGYTTAGFGATSPDDCYQYEHRGEVKMATFFISTNRSSFVVHHVIMISNG